MDTFAPESLSFISSILRSLYSVTRRALASKCALMRRLVLVALAQLFDSFYKNA